MRVIIEQHNGAWNVRSLAIVASGTAVSEDAARTAARATSVKVKRIFNNNLNCGKIAHRNLP